jgi:diguanylate cyclase (GGDEF)-like protein
LNKYWFRTSFLPAFIFVSTLTLSHLFALVIKNEALKVAYFDIAPVVINVLATVLLFWAAKRTRTTSHRLSLAWLLFAIAQLLYTLGDITWMVLELILKTAPYPSIADLFYMLNYPFFLVATFFLSNERSSPIKYLERSLDMLITLVAALLAIWYFLLRPLSLMAATASPLQSFLTIAYPAGDIVLFIALIWLFNHDPKRFSTIPVLFLFSGAFVTIIFDTIYSYQSYLGTYKGGSIIDIGWILSYLLIGLAAFHQAMFTGHEETMGRQQKLLQKFQGLLNFSIPYFPYFWMVIAYLLLFIDSRISRTEISSTLYFGVGLIIVLVILRQFIALYENSVLNRKLRLALDKVRSQTRVLEITNKELEVEIENRIKVEEQLSYDALHDSLTNLPNRAMFVEKLRQIIIETKVSPEINYSVLYMDIDQFKVINDSLGHHMGDELLKIMSARLKNCLRSTDAVARLGGDEFVFLIENIPSENAVDIIINRIKSELSSVIMLDGHPIFITTSIGVVWTLRGYDTPENVLRDADLAMYHAKHLGKDRFEVFHEGLRLQAISRLEIEENLRKAIKHQELELYYQPILELDNNQIVGFEALIRWNHPTFGIVYPAEFLPVAEETGLSKSIGQWCITEACRQIKNWQDEWPDTRHCYISINVSVKQFTGEDFIARVKSVLRETGVNPADIRLEITENTLIEYTEEVLKKFTELRDLGIKVSIDDFGTGYSSLSYLKDLPAASLKIDQSFIREIGINKSSMDLIKTMLSIGNDMGLEVIAEGIESPHQLQELINLSCKYGQGFLLALPMRVEEMEEVFMKNTMLFLK